MFQGTIFISILLSVCCAFAQIKKSETRQDQSAKNLSYLEFVVSDKGFESSDRILITKDEIQKSQAQSLPELLNKKAHITVGSSPIEPNSIFIRGGNSSHVLILIDDVPVYDTATIERTTDLSAINLLAIQSIEIIKGSQSVIYGGQALAGVIKITTDFKTDRAGDLKIQGNHLQQKIKAVKNIKINSSQAIFLGVASGFGFEKSPVENSDKKYSHDLLNMQGVYTQDFSLGSFFLKHSYSQNILEIPTVNDITSKPIDVDDYQTKSQINQSQIQLKILNRTQLDLTKNQSVRKYNLSLFKNPNGYALNEEYRGELTQINIKQKILNTLNLKLDLGLNLGFEKMTYLSVNEIKTDAKTQFEGFYIKNHFLIDRDLNIETGFRRDTQKSHFLAHTYQIGINYKKTIRYEHSTGFKAPSLYQLYGLFGDANLQSETSETDTIIYDWVMNSKISHSFAVFQTRYYQLIDYKPQPVNRYANYRSAKTQGVEYQLNINQLESGLLGSVAFSYQEPRDELNRQWLPRRPLVSYMIAIDQQLSDIWTIGFDYKFTGDRVDYFSLNGENQGTNLSGYDIVNMTLNYKLDFMNNRPMNWFLKVDNCFDQKFETSYQYFGERRQFELGVQIYL